MANTVEESRCRLHHAHTLGRLLVIVRFGMEFHEQHSCHLLREERTLLVIPRLMVVVALFDHFP